MNIELRQYQQELVGNIRMAIQQGYRAVCAILSCGGGKSVIAAHIAKLATQKGNRVLFIVHRKELCEQIRQTFIICGVDMNLCYVGMVQTVTNRLAKMEAPALIICDEAHHCLSATYRRIFDAYPDAKLVGFTATPVRLNDGGLGAVMDKLIESVTTRWLIENKHLAPYQYYSAPLADLSGLKVKRGEYDAAMMANIMEDKRIYGETVTNYSRIADGKKAIVYCVSVESAKQTANEFQANGYRAESLDGGTPKMVRQDIMQRFRENEIDILCNCELFGEGLDVPDVECVILLRKTKSLTLFIQQSMRSMRYKTGKTAIIIDHVRNVFEHGFPDDEREWSLEAKRKKSTCAVNIKQCDECLYVMPANAKVCPMCGKESAQEDDKPGDHEVVDMQLQLVTPEMIEAMRFKPYRYVSTIKTWAELEAFRKAKQYKPMWSIHQAISKGIEIPEKYQEQARWVRHKRARTHA